MSFTGDLTKLVLHRAQAGKSAATECQNRPHRTWSFDHLPSEGKCPVQTTYCIIRATQSVCCGEANIYSVKGTIGNPNPS